MRIELHELTVRDVITGYVDSGEAGVVGYGGNLNIRPPYQREFVYDAKQRDAVIDTIRKGFPLNVMYWMVNNQHTYEVMDGQQRSVSFCQYVSNDYSLDWDGHPKFFHNLTPGEQEQILDYPLMVYFCEGTDKEQLDWFRIINIAGEELTDQELRNAVYTGPWLAHAKTIFSKSNCPAYLLANRYVSGAPIRQDYLQEAIRWLAKAESPRVAEMIDDYMSVHQRDPNANELWQYFQAVIHWVEATFPTYRNIMKGIHWGPLYEAKHGEVLDTAKLENRIQRLLIDDDVTAKRGVYTYVLTGNERPLALRQFTPAQKIAAYETQKGICPVCKQHFEITSMQADHITPWSKGGRTVPDNCQMLCEEDNRRKGAV